MLLLALKTVDNSVDIFFLSLYLIPKSFDIFGSNMAVFQFRSQFWGYKTLWLHVIHEQNILQSNNGIFFITCQYCTPTLDI